MKNKLESFALSEDIPDDQYEKLYKICANIIHPFDAGYADFLKGLFDVRHGKGNIHGAHEILRLILKNRYQTLPRYHMQIGIFEMLAAKNCGSANLLIEGETDKTTSK